MENEETGKREKEGITSRRRIFKLKRILLFFNTKKKALGVWGSACPKIPSSHSTQNTQRKKTLEEDYTEG
jgi:hypothetical protein